MSNSETPTSYLLRLPCITRGRVGKPDALVLIEAPDSELVPHGAVLVASRFEVRLDDPGYPFVARANVELVEGNFRCRSLELVARDGEQIKTRAMRSFPVDSFIARDAAPLVVYRRYIASDGLRAHLRDVVPDHAATLATAETIVMPMFLAGDYQADMAQALTELQAATSKRMRRLQRVADAWIAAKALPRNDPKSKTGEAVRDALNLKSEAAARQYIREARAEGLIPPANRRPKGEHDG